MNRTTRSTWQGRLTITCVEVAALLLQSCKDRSPKRAPAPAVSSSVRTIQFSDGGHVTIERQGDVEQVDVEDGKGQMVSQSWCPLASGSFDATSALFRQFQKAVSAGDKPAVAALIHFPLRVNGRSGEVINRSADLLRGYRQVFTADVTKRIVAANPEVVFCRSPWRNPAIDHQGVVVGAVEPAVRQRRLVNHQQPLKRPAFWPGGSPSPSTCDCPGLGHVPAVG